MTGERYYDRYENRRGYDAVSRGRVRYMDSTRAAGVPGQKRMRSDYAPRRGQAPRYAATPQRPAQGRARTDVRYRGQASNRRPAARGRRRGVPLVVKLLLAALLLAVVIFGAVKLVGQLRTTTEERFVDNVYVNGIALTGYTQEEGLQLMAQLKDKWLNNTYTLTFGNQSWDFSPSMVNATLDMDAELTQAWDLGHVGDRSTRRQIVEGLKQAPAYFVSEPGYDEAALSRYVAEIAQAIDVDPVDAEVTLTEEKPVITRASENGLQLDQEALKATLVGLIKTGKGDTQLPVNEVQPAIVSDDMEMDKIVEIKTDVTFRGFDSRSNVRTALNHFNLFQVSPGQTVSFNEVVGPRTEAMGFKMAPEYAGSKEEMGVGGGVCQASTTLYDAMIQSGMTIIERHNHTMTVSYVEPSQDAAVNYGKKDFVFRNDTGHAIYIYTNVTKEKACVTVYGARPQYRLQLESVILSESKSDVIGYQDDLSGDHVYYTTDQPVLYKEGHGSCHSEGWLVSYDWESGQEVSRVKISYDMYSAGVNVYWRGIHNADGTTTTATEPPSQF